MLTLPIAVVQGISFLLILERQGVCRRSRRFSLGKLLVITAGSMLLMWIGELISEFGLGNGVSLIIFAGIVARLPQRCSRSALLV
jgi:preprotein translocase subunit SecY